MTSENLYKWAKQTMHSTDINKSQDLTIICRKQHEKIWRYIIQNVYSEETVKKVKGNLILFSNKSKIRRSELDKKNDEKNEKLLNKLSILKEKLSKKKSNNDLIEKDNQRMKDKVIHVESLKNRTKNTIMNTLSDNQSAKDLQLFLISNNNIIKLFIEQLKQHQQHYSSLIDSCMSVGISHKDTLQVSLEDILEKLKGVIEKKMLGEVNGGKKCLDDLYDNKYVRDEKNLKLSDVERGIADTTDTYVPYIVLEGLMNACYKGIRDVARICEEGEDKENSYASNDDGWLVVKDLIQNKQEWLLERRALVQEMKQNNCFISNNNKNNNDCYNILQVNSTILSEFSADNNTSLQNYKRSHQKWFQYEESRLGLEEYEVVLKTLKDEVATLKEKKALCVKKYHSIKSFKNKLRCRQSLIQAGLGADETEISDFLILQNKISEYIDTNVMTLHVDETVSTFVNLLQSHPLPATHINELRLLSVSDKRPMEYFGSRDENPPIIEDTLNQLKLSYHFHNYKSPDHFLEYISFYHNLLQTSSPPQHNLQSLLTSLIECTEKVACQKSNYLLEYEDKLENRLKMARVTLKRVNDVKQVIHSWWTQEGLMVEGKRRVDGMTAAEWMEVWKAHHLKLKQKH